MLKKSSQSLHSLFILLAVTLQCCSCFSVDNIQWKEVKIPVQNNDENNNIETFKNIQRKKMLNGKVPVSSRLVPLGIEGVPFVTIWELQNPSKLMEMWWAADMDSSSSVSKEKIGDPFGVVFWPGSMLASTFLGEHRKEVYNSTVLILGAGTGVEAQAAALLGAKKVIATDISTLTLKLLRYGAEQAGIDDIIEPVKFDLFSKEDLPECDIVVAADVLYNAELAKQIGLRCMELLSRLNPPKLLVTDSQRFHGTDFLDEVNDALSDNTIALRWDHFIIRNVTGSGVMIEGDQTYDAKTRLMSHGWEI